MADPKISVSSSELSKWGERLAAEDWSWLTWKYILGDAALIALWFVFILVLISLLIPSYRKKLGAASRVNVSGGTIFSAFVITWIIGAFGQGALFGPGPYSYWLHQLLGPDLFVSISDWTFRYLTIVGLLFG